MSHRRSTLFVLLVTLAVSICIVSGCSTGPPTRLYVLTSLPRAESVPPATGGRAMSVGIGPVELPQYVNRPQIVTGQQSSELQRNGLSLCRTASHGCWQRIYRSC